MAFALLKPHVVHRPRPRAVQTDLGRALVALGSATEARVADCERIAQRSEASLAETCLHHLALSHRELLTAHALASELGTIDPVADPPDATLLAKTDAETVLATGLLPWRRIGGTTVTLTYDPAKIHDTSETYALCTKPQFLRAVETGFQDHLVTRAETLVPAPMSCRNWPMSALQFGALLLTLAFAALFATRTEATLLSICILSLAIGIANTVLKAAALIAGSKRSPRPIPAQQLHSPVVTVFVPLFKESQIAEHLVQRINAIRYPRDLLDVCLLLEEDDTQTRQTLENCNLPRYMRVILVPKGRLRTKPRALNYALPFARGSIIGIYDAEDAPDPNQIRTIVAGFAAAPLDVACLQGRLDFYNSSRNWLARCFAIDYASWFRVILPGFARLGLVVPLGGTTLFFRRKILEEVGAWDAHNVTEDADLGVRLARLGYRTELVDSTTEEEANCRVIPWIRQRSRWLKGYAVTYIVHMRKPHLALKQLGLRRFLAFQVQFLFTLLSFLLAPMVWMFWLVALGLGLPSAIDLPAPVMVTALASLAVSEIINVSIAVIGLSRAGKRRHIPLIPLMHVYSAMASFAALKAIVELVVSPFYWDKTAHGHHS